VLVEDLKLKPDTLKLIVNRAPEAELAAGVLEEIKLQKLDLLGIIPQDETVYRYDAEGIPIANVPDDSPIKTALEPMIVNLGL
jgi:CO dehydrogenase maturation factor